MLRSIVRFLTVRGRKAARYFSCDGWPTGTDEPQRSDFAQIGQHYGLVSELPDNGKCVAVGVNGGATNLISVAEIDPDAPTVEQGEVLLYAKWGQRVLLKNNGNVVIMPSSTGKILLGVESGGDPVVTESRLSGLIAALKGHKHEETGATTLVSTELASLSVSGSPDVRAK